MAIGRKTRVERKSCVGKAGVITYFGVLKCISCIFCYAHHVLLNIFKLDHAFGNVLNDFVLLDKCSNSLLLILYR